eukprot:UN13579
MNFDISDFSIHMSQIVWLILWRVGDPGRWC